jgi:excisionase family DNA binding protein
MPDQLLTVNQTCAVLQVGRTRLYELIRAGELKSVMLGRRSRRIPQSSIDKLIAKRSRGAA